MDAGEVRALAARREDHHLDFKSNVYTSNEELAKDLMAIANLLPPGTSGHILIGVKEKSDGTGEIVGTVLGSDRDHQYQQKVASKLNRSPQFTFFALQLSDQEVGVFEITGVGERPYFPLVTAGKLKKFVPQKRVGSSTADATPDEVKEWVLEDRPTTDPALLLERIPAPERDQLLIIADMLNDNYSLLHVSPFRATLVNVDRVRAAARFVLKQYNREVSIPLSAVLSQIWKDGSDWKVVIEGCLRGYQNKTLWEYQPRSRSMP